MSELNAASIIHFYDTRTRRILCGVRGAEHHSTKHPRSVTCHFCVGLLSDRPARDTEAARAAPGQAN
jgi:hypothetical protein